MGRSEERTGRRERRENAEDPCLRRENNNGWFAMGKTWLEFSSEELEV
jgi:hypothetical protein